MGKAKTGPVCLLNIHFGPKFCFIVHRADSTVKKKKKKQAGNNFLADFNIKYLDSEAKTCS